MYMVNIKDSEVDEMWDMKPSTQTVWETKRQQVRELTQQFYFQIPALYLCDHGEDPKTWDKWWEAHNMHEIVKKLDDPDPEKIPTWLECNYNHYMSDLFSVRALYKTSHGIHEYPGHISSHVYQFNAIIAANQAFNDRLKDPEMDFKPLLNGSSIGICDCQGFYGIRIMQHSTFKTIYTIKVKDEERRQMVSHQKDIALQRST